MQVKVGVVFGGKSVEHEVSIISAIQAMNKMNGEKYEIIPLYITKDGKWYTGEILRDIEIYQDLHLLKKYAKNVNLIEKGGRFVLQGTGFFKREVGEVDLIFPITHGTNVEDGVLQGYLQTVGVPYVGSNVYASVVGQDKVYMKALFKEAGLPITKYVWFYDTDYKNEEQEVLKKINTLKYPVIVKPATTGSSIGIGTANNEKELTEAIDDAISYDHKVIVEEMVQNLKEVNISVLGNYETQEVSVIEEVFSKDKILTYEDKYVGSSKVKGKLGAKYPVKGSKGMASLDRKIPADLSEKLEKEVQEYGKKAFKTLGSSGVARVDLLIDNKTKKLYLNEINSIPGSLAFYLWEPAGKDYTDLLDEMITIGIRDYKKRGAKTHSFQTNILEGFAQNAGIKGLKGIKGMKQK